MAERKRLERVRCTPTLSAFELLGEPRLLDDKERRAYLRLRDYLEQTLVPEDLSEHQEIIDFAWRRIRQLRLEAAEADLIEGPFVLSGQLEIFCGENIEKPQQLALDYCD